jgi:hypothetical protein
MDTALPPNPTAFTSIVFTGLELIVSKKGTAINFLCCNIITAISILSSPLVPRLCAIFHWLMVNEGRCNQKIISLQYKGRWFKAKHQINSLR